MSADDTSALRLLAAADRVREAAAVVATADVFRTEARSALERKAAKLGCDIYDPRVSSLQHVSIATERGHRETCEELEAAIADLTAIALEPGDCAWERAVLGAAESVQVAMTVRADAQAACDELAHLIEQSPDAPLEEDVLAKLSARALGIIGDEAAERALLAAARGAR